MSKNDLVCLLFMTQYYERFFVHATFFEGFFLGHKKSGPAMEPPKTNNLLK